jgi:hypothetical protein
MANDCLFLLCIGDFHCFVSGLIYLQARLDGSRVFFLVVTLDKFITSSYFYGNKKKICIENFLLLKGGIL